MAVPPHVLPPPAEPLTSNRLSLSGDSFAHADLDHRLVVRRVPSGKRIRAAWSWKEHSLTIWLEKIVPGERYALEVINATFEVQAADQVAWEAPPPDCRWLPVRFWERHFWTRR